MYWLLWTNLVVTLLIAAGLTSFVAYRFYTRMRKTRLAGIGRDPKDNRGTVRSDDSQSIQTQTPGIPPLFDARLTDADIDRGASIARGRFPEHELVLLRDFDLQGALPDELIGSIDCRTYTLSMMSSASFDKTIFLYGCACDDIGLPFIQLIVQNHGTFVPVWKADPSSYYHQNQNCRDVLDAEWLRQNVEGFAKWDFGPGDFVNLCQFIDLTSHVEGVFVEIGAFNGSSGSVAAAYYRKLGIRRKCFFFDVFSGFDYRSATDSSDNIWRDTHRSHGEETVESRLKRHECSGGPEVNVQRLNVITDQWPHEAAPIALANIDCDLYEAVRSSLDAVSLRMAKGGIILVEDPGHTPLLIGARLALEEFLNTSTGAAWFPIYLESGQTCLLPRTSHPSTNHTEFAKS